MPQRKRSALKIEDAKNCKEDIQELIRQCNDKQKQFYLNLINPDFDYNADLLTVYLEAGYANCSTAIYKARQLFYSPRIQKLLTFHRENLAEKKEMRALTVFEDIDLQLVWLQKEAKDKNDLQTLRAVLMDRAKLHGLLADRTIISTDDPLHLPDAIKRQAIEEAHKLLLEGDITEALTADDDNTIDAEFVDETGDSGPSTDSQQIDDSFLIDDN